MVTVIKREKEDEHMSNFKSSLRWREGENEIRGRDGSLTRLKVIATTNQTSETAEILMAENEKLLVRNEHQLNYLLTTDPTIKSHIRGPGLPAKWTQLILYELQDTFGFIHLH